MNPIHWLRHLGALVIAFFGFFGSVTLLAAETVRSVFVSRPRFAPIAGQIVKIGFGAQFVVIVTGCFTGSVFAAQMYFKLSEYGLQSATGPVLSLAMARELGPVLTALMVAGWGGTAMAAEIGTMKATEQIDALRSMGVHPVDHLVKPRVIAMFFCMPLLTAEAIGFGIWAGYLVAVHYFHMSGPWFQQQIEAHTGLDDIAVGMIKGVVFAGIVVIFACQRGLAVKRDAASVGQAATTAFVFSALGIFMTNLCLTFLLDRFFPLSG